MSEEVVATPEAEPTSLLDNATPDLGEGEYFLAEGVKGVGDKPEWYDSNRFKSVDQQAKSYLELEKKFGSFTGTPKDGYKMPEGVDAEDELMKAFSEFATNSNMNQEGFEKGFELLSTQAVVSQEVNQEAEIAKLGDNANERITAVESALKFKAGDGYSEIQEMITTADDVMLAERLIKTFAPGKLPVDGGEEQTGLTWADIEVEMNKKDDHGRFLRSSSPEHNAKVERMMKEFEARQP